MNIDNQNRFYTSISKYYSEIFPYNPAQLNFVKNRVGELNEKQILDIGCATGELAFQLAQAGAKVTGIDLNKNLLEQAKTNKIHANLTFQFGNMLNLKNDFQQDQFDAVLCFGNTLVHLEDEKQVLQMFSGVFSVLETGGHFLIQILNYDFIIDEQITELPLIETESIKFIRKYHFENSQKHVFFQTDLVLKKENDIISNETKLLALKSKDLIAMLKNAGFLNIELYSNFKQDSFGGKHLPLVFSCRK
jgi:glycine/sarcosine N-methyltransferase